MIDAGAVVGDEMRNLAESRTQTEMLVARIADADLADQVSAAWQSHDFALSMILGGDISTPYLNVIADGRALLEFATLEVMDDASRIFEQGEDVTMNDVVAFDLVERQEVYVQKMKLLACQMATDPSADIVADLKDTIDLFERSLMALRDGMPEMGLVASTDYVVQQAIAAVDFEWDTARAVLEQIAAARAATEDDLSAMNVQITSVESRMHALAEVYLIPADEIAEAAVAQLVLDAE